MKPTIIEISPFATNADGTGLYQCPCCNQWTEGEEGDTVCCDYCGKPFKACFPAKNKEEARVINMEDPSQPNEA